MASDKQGEGSSPDPLSETLDFVAAGPSKSFLSSAVRPGSQSVVKSKRAPWIRTRDPVTITKRQIGSVASVTSTGSPRKQMFELAVGSAASPQRIFVTVEAEDPEVVTPDKTRRTLFPLASESPARSRARRRSVTRDGTQVTTTVVPLRDAETPRKKGRPRKNGTPHQKTRRARPPTPMKPTPTRMVKNNDSDPQDDEGPASIALSPTPRRQPTPRRPTPGRMSRAGTEELEELGTPTPRKRGRPRTRSISPKKPRLSSTSMQLEPRLELAPEWEPYSGRKPALESDTESDQQLQPDPGFSSPDPVPHSGHDWEQEYKQPMPSPSTAPLPSGPTPSPSKSSESGESAGSEVDLVEYIEGPIFLDDGVGYFSHEIPVGAVDDGTVPPVAEDRELPSAEEAEPRMERTREVNDEVESDDVWMAQVSPPRRRACVQEPGHVSRAAVRSMRVSLHQPGFDDDDDTGLQGVSRDLTNPQREASLPVPSQPIDTAPIKEVVPSFFSTDTVAAGQEQPPLLHSQDKIRSPWMKQSVRCPPSGNSLAPHNDLEDFSLLSQASARNQPGVHPSRTHEPPQSTKSDRLSDFFSSPRLLPVHQQRRQYHQQGTVGQQNHSNLSGSETVHARKSSRASPNHTYHEVQPSYYYERTVQAEQDEHEKEIEKPAHAISKLQLDMETPAPEEPKPEEVARWKLNLIDTILSPVRAFRGSHNQTETSFATVQLEANNPRASEPAPENVRNGHTGLRRSVRHPEVAEKQWSGVTGRGASLQSREPQDFSMLSQQSLKKDKAPELGATPTVQPANLTEFLSPPHQVPQAGATDHDMDKSSSATIAVPPIIEDLVIGTSPDKEPTLPTPQDTNSPELAGILTSPAAIPLTAGVPTRKDPAPMKDSAAPIPLPPALVNGSINIQAPRLAPPEERWLAQIPEKTFYRAPAKANLFRAALKQNGRKTDSQRDPSTPPKQTSMAETENSSIPIEPIPQKRNFDPRPGSAPYSLFHPDAAYLAAHPPQEPSIASQDESSMEIQRRREELRPLPPREMSPSKSCIRSPERSKTAGRVVTFTSSVLSSLDISQAEASTHGKGCNMNGNENGQEDPEQVDVDDTIGIDWEAAGIATDEPASEQQQPDLSHNENIAVTTPDGQNSTNQVAIADLEPKDEPGSGVNLSAIPPALGSHYTLSDHHLEEHGESVQLEAAMNLSAPRQADENAHLSEETAADNARPRPILETVNMRLTDQQRKGVEERLPEDHGSLESEEQKERSGERDYVPLDEPSEGGEQHQAELQDEQREYSQVDHSSDLRPLPNLQSSSSLASVLGAHPNLPVHQTSEASSGRAARQESHPSIQAKPPAPQEEHDRYARIPHPLSQTEWTGAHWARLEQLLNARKAGQLRNLLQTTMDPGLKLAHEVDVSELDNLVGREIKAESKGVSMEVQGWQVEVVKAFVQVVGGWDIKLVSMRLFALMVGAWARQEEARKMKKRRKDEMDAGYRQEASSGESRNGDGDEKGEDQEERDSIVDSMLEKVLGRGEKRRKCGHDSGTQDAQQHYRQASNERHARPNQVSPTRDVVGLDAKPNEVRALEEVRRDQPRSILRKGLDAMMRQKEKERRAKRAIV